MNFFPMRRGAMRGPVSGLSVALTLLLAVPLPAGAADPVSGGEPRPRKGAVIEDQEVFRSSGISLPAVLALDVALPGGGHFYRGDYANGFLFMTMKLAGFYSLYYFNARREAALSDLRDVKRGGAADGSVRRGEIRYDRASQLVTFSVIGNLMIYFLSAAVNYTRVMKVNESAFPSFDVISSLNGRSGIDPVFSVKFTHRF